MRALWPAAKVMGVAYGGVDSYDFHILEVVQASSTMQCTVPPVASASPLARSSNLQQHVLAASLPGFGSIGGLPGSCCWGSGG